MTSKAKAATNKKLGEAQVILVDYLKRHSVPIRPNEGGYQYTFELNSTNIKAFFLDEDSTLAPTCILGKSVEGAPSPPVSDDKSRGTGRLLIRNSSSDLHIGQGDPAFKNLQRATFSINSDQLQSTTTYNIQGVVGYGAGQLPVPSWSGAFSEIIPYVSYTRQYVDGKNPTKISNVDNVGVGVIGDLLFPAVGLQNDILLTRGIYNDVQLSSQFVHSNRSDAGVVSGAVTYTPYINPLVVPGIATTERVGDFVLMLLPRAVYIFGDVVNSGNNITLAGNNSTATKTGNDPLTKLGTFQRLGGHLEFSASADTGILQGVGVNVSYDYLKSYGGGPISQVTLFTAVLSYTMPKQEYWSVQLKYSDGRNLDTLEQQQLLTLGVGAKY